MKFSKFFGKLVRTLLWLVSSVLALLVIVIFLIRLPPVQNYITHKVAAYISSKTHTRIELKRVYVSFPKTFVLQQLFAEDAAHDTLVAVQDLEVNLNMLALIHKKVAVKTLFLSGATCYIKRGADSTYNFDFLIHAFSPGAGKKKVAAKIEGKKDTVGWQIDVNKVQLHNIRGGFTDKVAGTSINGFIGSLLLNMKTIDIKYLSFTGKDLALSDAQVTLVQTRHGAALPDTSVTLMPVLRLDKLQIHNTGFVYNDDVNGQRYDIYAGNVFILPEKIDLNHQLIQVKEVRLDSSTTAIALRKDMAQQPVAANKAASHQAPMWHITAGAVKVKRVNFKLDFTNVPRQAAGIDYNHLTISNANIDIENAFYAGDEISGTVNNISLAEHSGFQLKKLSAQVIYNNKHAALKNLDLVTNQSHISRNLSITYNGIESIGKNPGQLGIDADFRNTHISVEDILAFVPQLKKNNFFAANRSTVLSLDGRIKGRLNDLAIPFFTVTNGNGIFASVNGSISGLPDALNAFYDVRLDSIHACSACLNQLLPGLLPNSIRMPEEMSVRGQITGSLKNATTHLSLSTSKGTADIEAALQIAGTDTAYSAHIQTHNLDVGYIIKQDSLLGPVTAGINLRGHNISLSNMDDSLEAAIESIKIYKYNYQNLQFTTEAFHNAYSASLNVKDTNLVMQLQATACFVKDSQYIKASGNIEGAALQKLRLVNQDIRTSGALSVNLKGDFLNPTGSVLLDNVVIRKGGDAYHLDSLLATSINDDKHATLKVQSALVNADYEGNIKIAELPGLLLHHFNHYFAITKDTDLTYNDTSNRNFKLDVEVFPSAVIGALLPRLQNFDGATLHAGFNNNTNSFKLNADASSFAYGGLKASDIHADISTQQNSMDYNVSLQSLETGPVRLAETSLSGSIANQQIVYAIRVHGSDTLDKLKITGTCRQDSTKDYVFHFDNQGLVLNNEKWNVPPDNSIRFGSRGIAIHHLVLNNNTQSLSANSPANDLHSLNIDFKNFGIGSLSQIIERDSELARGIINGSVALHNLSSALSFESKLNIDSLTYQTRPIGNITLTASNINAGKYTANLKLNGFGNDVSVDGDYVSTGATNLLDFKLNIRKLNAISIEPFSAGQLRRSSGYLTGNIDIGGTTSQPVFNGDIWFKNVSFNLAYINNYLTLKNEHIAIDNKGIYFRSFNILDSLKATAGITGAIYTSNFKNMQFDVHMTTEHFTILNTTMKDNPLFFGKVILNSNIIVKGNEQLPVVKADAKLVDGSKITVVIPSSQISTDRGQGVVVLTDADSIAKLMNATDTLLVTDKFKGIELNANLDITKATTLKLIVDKSSGDSLVVQGDGVLSFAMDETGNQSLTGTYNLSGGSYRASFQKVIKRELKIQPGGSITWNGNPLDATLDITAEYSTKAAPSDLLSSELASASASELNSYKNLVNFNVLMSIKGQLMKPQISFKLDMDPADQGTLGGTVYAKVLSVDNDPTELNKQIFALLVVGSFIPDNLGSGGGSGTNYGYIATSLARNSVNQILTDELNRLSGRFLKGFDVNVGINSNDQYSGNGLTQNTQVSASVKKSFFNERLSVQVGTSINVQNDNGAVSGTNAQNLTGDIVVEYKVNKDGSLRFKAFRQNDYDDFIDGTVYQTGVGIVFNRDYNKVKELFERHKKKKVKTKANKPPVP